MDSRSTPAAEVSAIIFSDYIAFYRFLSGYMQFSEGKRRTHGDLDIVVCEDKGGVGRSEFDGGLHRKRARQSCCSTHSTP